MHPGLAQQQLVSSEAPTCWDGSDTSPLVMYGLIRSLEPSGAGEPAASTGARARGVGQLNNLEQIRRVGTDGELDT
jgi:hypothetical protein